MMIFRYMDLPRRFSYRPQWGPIGFMLALGAAFLALVSRISFGFGLVLGSLTVALGLLAAARRLFFPRFIELGESTLLLPNGFLQARISKINYADVAQVSEVAHVRVTTLKLQTKAGNFEINSMLLPHKSDYLAIRDFVYLKVGPNGTIDGPVEAGKYGFNCSYEGNGEIYNSNGQIVWRFKTLHRHPHYPYGLIRLPDFVVYDQADQESFRFKLRRKWPLAQFLMLEKNSPVCTLKQQSIFRNRFALDFANGQKWVFRQPLFSVEFGGSSETGGKIRVRMQNHNVWHVLIDADLDNPALIAALAFIHRERLRFN